MSHLKTLFPISGQISVTDRQFTRVKDWYFDCSPCGMMTIFFIALALTAAGLITELIAANHAPFGYQDEGGFHFGNIESGNPAGFENPS